MKERQEISTQIHDPKVRSLKYPDSEKRAGIRRHHILSWEKKNSLRNPGHGRSLTIHLPTWLVCSILLHMNPLLDWPGTRSVIPTMLQSVGNGMWINYGLLFQRSFEQDAHHIFCRGSLSKIERRQYIDAVLCLMSKSPRFSPDKVPGARNRFDDFAAVHINQTLAVYGMVSQLTFLLSLSDVFILSPSIFIPFCFCAVW